MSAFLRERGHDARRGQQFSGSPESPDVVSQSLSQFHIEAKRVEKLNMADAMAQATKDAGPKIPLVIHRKNHGEWNVNMRLEDFLCLLNLQRAITGCETAK